MENWVRPSESEIEEMRRCEEIANRHRQMEEDERRRGSRLAMFANVTLLSETNFFMGLSENISEGGVFVATMSPPAEGEQVQLKITVDGGQPVSVEGVVRWMRSDEDGNYTGCGIQFTDVRPDVREVLDTLLGHIEREPLLSDV